MSLNLYRVETVVYVLSSDKNYARRLARENTEIESGTVTSAEIEQCADDGWLDIKPINADITCQDIFEECNKQEMTQ